MSGEFEASCPICGLTHTDREIALVNKVRKERSQYAFLEGEI